MLPRLHKRGHGTIEPVSDGTDQLGLPIGHFVVCHHGRRTRQHDVLLECRGGRIVTAKRFVDDGEAAIPRGHDLGFGEVQHLGAVVKRAPRFVLGPTPHARECG